MGQISVDCVRINTDCSLSMGVSGINCILWQCIRSCSSSTNCNGYLSGFTNFSDRHHSGLADHLPLNHFLLPVTVPSTVSPGHSGLPHNNNRALLHPADHPGPFQCLFLPSHRVFSTGLFLGPSTFRTYYFGTRFACGAHVGSLWCRQWFRVRSV